MTLSRIAFVAIALLFVLGGAAQAAGQTAEQFLRGIYNAYVGDPEKAPTIRLEDQANIRKYFEPKLAGMMIADEAMAAQNEDVPTLDFDPFVNGQDFTIQGAVSIKVAQETATGAQAVVTFVNSGARQTLTYKLVKANGEWKIYDIGWSGSGGAGSLRKLYAQ